MSDLSDLTRVKSLEPDMSGLQRDFLTCPALLRTCLGPNSIVSSERDFFSEWPEPVWSLHTHLTGILNRSALTTPTISFPRFL
jgi:hypothetical protein